MEYIYLEYYLLLVWTINLTEHSVFYLETLPVLMFFPLSFISFSISILKSYLSLKEKLKCHLYSGLFNGCLGTNKSFPTSQRLRNLYILNLGITEYKSTDIRGNLVGCEISPDLLNTSSDKEFSVVLW